MNEATPQEKRRFIRRVLTWRVRFVALGLWLLAGCTLAAPLWWVFELTTHFMPYHAGAAAFVLAMALAFRDRWAIMLAAVPVVYFAALLAPFYTGTPQAQAGAPGETTILLANVLASNTAHGELTALTGERGPAVVALVEYSDGWGQALHERLTRDYPHHAVLPRRDVFGLALFSKHPLESISFPMTDSARSIPMLQARVMDPAQPYWFMLVHTMPPVRGELAALRNRQLDLFARRVQALEGPLIVAGDFNASPWSPQFRAMKRAAGLSSSRRGHGICFSWRLGGLPIHVPIDHVLFSSHWRASSCEVGPDIGSDHWPLLVSLAPAP